MECIHPTFPIVRKDVFTSQYLTALESLAKAGRKWLAVLNLILAIRYECCRYADSRMPNDVNGSVLFGRALALSANENIIYDRADLQQVQVEVLIALSPVRADQQVNPYTIQIGINLVSTSIFS
jgi:hypothetical protein